MTNQEAVLVTGGAGYIGSHVAMALLDAQIPVVIIDNLSTGVRNLVPADAIFIEGNVGDQSLVKATIEAHKITSVMHFAAATVVPESVTNPIQYYQNNTMNTCNLLAVCTDTGIENFVFSSTAAVYGEVDGTPVSEGASTAPISPYGWSKLMSEQMIKDTANTGAFKHGILRYFNVAGADEQGRSGQATPNATHLIKVACEAATGKRAGLAVFGNQFDTIDGTGVRDYIHVSDLANVHVAALKHLQDGGASFTLNCGYGRGFSVLDVINCVSKIAGHDVPYTIEPPRPGDAAAVIADATKVGEVLDWQPKWDTLEIIVKTALAWERGK